MQAGHLSVEDALEQINGVKELGYAAIDTDRQRRNGFPEVVYGEGKTVEQMEGITAISFTKRIADPHNKSLSPKGRGSFSALS